VRRKKLNEFSRHDPMAVGAYLAAKELNRDKEMIFVGVDGLGGPDGGIKKVIDGVLAATFIYPLGVNEAVDITQKILRDPAYRPQKELVSLLGQVAQEQDSPLGKELPSLASLSLHSGQARPPAEPRHR